jgi:hypothetical protein
VITEKDLDNMDLPKANYYEELETLSEHNFQPLFKPSLFELCTRDRRDKGIDLSYEIKRDGKHLGFRFIIQLKSTDSIEPNKTDGSYSKSIDTSNINALLNNGHPAFYAIYIVSTNTFYYESLSAFLKYLNEKDKEWGKQESHTLRFTKKLLPEGINSMYDSALKNGLFQRNLIERATYISTSVNKSDRISLDADFNITDDAKIRELIECLGFELINEGKWSEILLVHQKASGNVSISARYNLILGIANYYSGNRWDSISFLKKAGNIKSELDEEMQMHLSYFDTTVRYACGLITDEEYHKRILHLEKSETIGLYIKLDNAKRTYSESLNNNVEETFDLYLKEIEEIINHPNANNGLILTAKCELILFQGFTNNLAFIKNIAELNVIEELFGVDVQERIESGKKLKDISHKWFEDVETVIKEAQKQKNKFAYYTATTNEAKVSYQFMVYSSMVFVEKQISGRPTPQMPDSSESLDRRLNYLNEATNFFNQIGHTENTIATLSTMYEILHYRQMYDDANLIINKLEELIEKFDLQDHKKRLELLKNGGSTHESFKSWKDQIFANAENRKKELDKMSADMIEMDEVEKRINKDVEKECYVIELFPIRYFKFPIMQKEKIFTILQINNPEIQNQFDKMFKIGIPPIANIYYCPIEQEGPQDGNFADKGIESWRNIFRIRKAFYENKFYRFELR